MSLNLEKYICFPKISRTAFFQNTYQCIWMLVWFCKKHEKPPLKVFCKKRCLRACSHERRNELIPVWDFKPAWKQVLFTWSFISAAFQNDPIFWWTCADISFRIVFTYFITRNETSFLSKWHESALIHFVSCKMFTWKSHAGLKFNFGQNDQYEIHTVLSFISPQFMWTQVKSWLNTEVRFSTEMKSHTGLNSVRLSC